MKPWRILFCFVFVCGLGSFQQQASAAHGAHSQCFCCAQKTCSLTVSTATDTSECFDVECKDICIPPVTFPWECRPKSCGRVRTVNVLTTEEREQTVCKYEWDIVVICPRCRDALHASGCEVAPGVQVLGDSTSTAWPIPPAAIASPANRTSATLSFAEELLE